jgi:hypothetical protein
MKLHELPTHLVRELAERCAGLNASLGDERVALFAAIDACYREVERRQYEAVDFPEPSSEAVAALAALIKTSKPTEFARLVYELDL